MDTSAKIKEQIIGDYIANQNLRSGNFSVKAIKEDLKRLLKEEPGVQIGWKKEEMTTEVKGMNVTKNVESVKSITIAFTDGEDVSGKPRVHSVKYYVHK
jgi:hypothetical protein